MRDELSVEHDVIFRGERAVIPTSLRAETMEKIHESYLGIENCLKRARKCLYWPDMHGHLKTLESVQCAEKFTLDSRNSP